MKAKWVSVFGAGHMEGGVFSPGPATLSRISGSLKHLIPKPHGVCQMEPEGWPDDWRLSCLIFFLDYWIHLGR